VINTLVTQTIETVTDNRMRKFEETALHRQMRQSPRDILHQLIELADRAHIPGPVAADHDAKLAHETSPLRSGRLDRLEPGHAWIPAMIAANKRWFAANAIDPPCALGRVG